MNTLVKTANHAVASGTSKFNLVLTKSVSITIPKHIWFLWTLITIMIASALTIVYVQADNRYLYNELQNLQQVREDLRVQWTQLVLEENTLIAPARIQAVAEKQLNMLVPAKYEIVTTNNS